jgi:Uma2 family endonuclease
MSRVSTPWRQPPLTQEEQDELFMLLLKDDTEDAPWMVMGDLQFWSASSFAHSLRNYGHEKGLGWYVASMHPIIFTWGPTNTRHQLAPDVYVAFVPEHPRQSYDVQIEGSFPPFVLEVVSPASTGRDRDEKKKAYELTGVQEYALFTPYLKKGATLQGYRRRADGNFAAWRPDAEGRLWSDLLGLYLVVRGRMVQAYTADGTLLLTPEQADVERRRAEAEVERLRRELERYQNRET